MTGRFASSVIRQAIRSRPRRTSSPRASLSKGNRLLTPLLCTTKLLFKRTSTLLPDSTDARSLPYRMPAYEAAVKSSPLYIGSSMILAGLRLCFLTKPTPLSCQGCSALRRMPTATGSSSMPALALLTLTKIPLHTGLTYTMASAAPLCDIEIGQSEVALIWLDGLTDYYYEFIVSPARERRNVFRGIWPSETFASFHAGEVTS